jgi:hypothetical protein
MADRKGRTRRAGGGTGKEPDAQIGMTELPGLHEHWGYTGVGGRLVRNLNGSVYPTIIYLPNNLKKGPLGTPSLYS